MNMKKSFIGILAATIILSGCGTSQMAAGDPNAVLAGAAIGSNVGGAIGGLIGTVTEAGEEDTGVLPSAPS